MECYKPLQDRFRRLNQTAREWLPNSGFPRSRETVNTIIYRDEPVEPVAYAYMAHCLGFTNKEVLDCLELYLDERPEKSQEIRILRKFIMPVDTTPEEQDMIDKFRKLPESKRAAYLALLES